MRRLRRILLSPYHFLWALGSAIWYRFPGKRLTVIGITGTKGKSSVAEMLYTILSAAGHTVALAGTIRFAIGTESRPNRYKMTLPGRGFIQKFLAEAALKGATYAVIEITSEAVLQHRHRFLCLDALVFTGLHREHIESHGSLEKYFRAKYAIGRELARSSKRPRAIVANGEDPRAPAFLALAVETPLRFCFSDAEKVELRDEGASFSYHNAHFALTQPGRFSVMNALAATKAAEWLGVPVVNCARALSGLTRIPGRVERVEAGQDFLVIVDYAHTPDSLKALYGTFSKRRKICVLGNTGGGRDVWKRPLMGTIADEHCAEVILTNEDPYDEDPRAIAEAMARGMTRPPQIIMDRREAIRAAIRAARPGDAVLITGKGTDPFIMGRRGNKIPWSDAQVAREELGRLPAGKAGFKS